MCCLTDDGSSSARHRRFRHAKKKLRKQQRLLREVVVSSDQLTFSSADTDKEIIVFDGGNSGCPTITPPTSIKWRCHHVSELHIQDDIQGDIGLTTETFEPSVKTISRFLGRR